MGWASGSPQCLTQALEVALLVARSSVVGKVETILQEEEQWEEVKGCAEVCYSETEVRNQERSLVHSNRMFVVSSEVALMG